MSVLVSPAGVCEPEAILGLHESPAAADVPVHCGIPMELGTPALGQFAAGYTFDAPAEPVRLPPVWRCGCGFQLDAWDATFLAGYNTALGPFSALTP